MTQGWLLLTTIVLNAEVELVQYSTHNVITAFCYSEFHALCMAIIRQMTVTNSLYRSTLQKLSLS